MSLDRMPCNPTSYVAACRYVAVDASRCCEAGWRGAAQDVQGLGFRWDLELRDYALGQIAGLGLRDQAQGIESYGFHGGNCLRYCGSYSCLFPIPGFCVSCFPFSAINMYLVVAISFYCGACQRQHESESEAKQQVLGVDFNSPQSYSYFGFYIAQIRKLKTYQLGGSGDLASR